MNINKDSLIKGINLSGIEYPTVVIKDREISRELKGFLGRRFSIEVIFGQILSQLEITSYNFNSLKQFLDENIHINICN